jgi:hypothetical protein
VDDGFERLIALAQGGERGLHLALAKTVFVRRVGEIVMLAIAHTKKFRAFLSTCATVFRAQAPFSESYALGRRQVKISISGRGISQAASLAPFSKTALFSLDISFGFI